MRFTRAASSKYYAAIAIFESTINPSYRDKAFGLLLRRQVFGATR